MGVVFMSLEITKNQSGFGDYLPYRTIVNDAAGIFPKTPIKVAGINAGRITKIDLVGSQALITFEVLEEIAVTDRSILRIKSVGFLGDKYLDIFLGANAGSTKLQSGAMIPSESGGGMEDLTKDASYVLKDLKEIMKNVRVAIAPGGTSPIKKIVDNLEAATRNANRVMEAFTANNKIETIMDNIAQLTQALANETNTRNKESLLSELKRLGPILEKADASMADFRTIMSDLKSGKGTIGKLLRDEDIIDQVSETLSGVNKIVNKVNSVQTELALYSGINSDSGNVSTLNLDIYPAPERYYRIGMLTSEIGVASEKEISETVNGVTTTSTRKESMKNSYRFNAQIGRKIQAWGFRAGMIESTGGVGVDYFFRKQGSILSLEMFDYRKELGLNLRLLLELHMWNVFYSRMSAEDLISKTGDRSFTVGVGLRFNDEDLKGLLGFFL